MAREDLAAADRETQRAVLLTLLDAGATWLSRDELVRAVATGEAAGPDWPATDAVVRAVRDLAADGLLHRLDQFVQPTVAARRCVLLLDGLR